MDPPPHRRRPGRPRPGPVRRDRDGPPRGWAAAVGIALALGVAVGVPAQLAYQWRYGPAFDLGRVAIIVGAAVGATTAALAFLRWWRGRPRRGYDPDLTAALDRHHQADAPTTHVRTTGERWAATHHDHPGHHHTDFRGDHTHDGGRGDVVLQALPDAPDPSDPAAWPRAHSHDRGGSDPDRPALAHQRHDQRGGA
jgi:hypothetical protein